MQTPKATLLALSASLLVTSCDAKVDSLFDLNRQRQEEGYYMGEFEFKMLGIAILAGKGHLIRAGLLINRLHYQLKEKEGLIKIPDFKSKDEEIEFYLNRQNPKTGAFMDDRYPYSTFDEPTLNVLQLIDPLLEEGEHLQLKHKLTYLERIATPEELLAYLEDVTFVTEDELDYPQTSFHFARTVLSHLEPDGVTKKHQLFSFSPEWEDTLLQWFYTIQDRKTGFWGPILENNNELGAVDLSNTASIVKAFVDGDGEDIYPDYPLRFRSELIDTALEIMAEESDGEAEDLSDWHERTLRVGKGIKMLTEYLLHRASAEDRDKTTDVILDYMRSRYRKCYIESEGAFSYYPDEEHASLDGVGMMVNLFVAIGALSAEKQSQLWSSPLASVTDLQTLKLPSLSEYDFRLIEECDGANSFRFYSGPLAAPDDALYEAAFAYYPQTPVALDVVDILPKLRAWLEATSLSIGNWTAREKLLDTLRDYELSPIPIYSGEVPREAAQTLFDDAGSLTLVGFNTLQLPVCGTTIIQL